MRALIALLGLVGAASGAYTTFYSLTACANSPTYASAFQSEIYLTDVCYEVEPVVPYPSAYAYICNGTSQAIRYARSKTQCFTPTNTSFFTAADVDTRDTMGCVDMGAYSVTRICDASSPAPIIETADTPVVNITQYGSPLSNPSLLQCQGTVFKYEYQTIGCVADTQLGTGRFNLYYLNPSASQYSALFNCSAGCANTTCSGSPSIQAFFGTCSAGEMGGSTNERYLLQRVSATTTSTTSGSTTTTTTASSSTGLTTSTTEAAQTSASTSTTNVAASLRPGLAVLAILIGYVAFA